MEKEVFNADHRVVSQRGSASGRFTFTAADSGEHKICFTPSSTRPSGWLSSGNPVGGVKLTLDMAIGETSAIESADKDKIQDIVAKVKDLNGRLLDIRREQVFQRVSSVSLFPFFLLSPSALCAFCLCAWGAMSRRDKAPWRRRRRRRAVGHSAKCEISGITQSELGNMTNPTR